MTRSNPTPLFMIFTFACTLLISCVEQPAEVSQQPQVNPVPFPDTGIPGFELPTDSTIINQWVDEQNNEEIHKHGWGIWAGLTTPTDLNIGGSNLLVYETWLTPDEIIDRIHNSPQPRSASGRPQLKVPNQLIHAAGISGNPVDTVFEAVSYSPSAAGYALENEIFLYTTLAEYENEGLEEIPPFPNDAITIKPVFKVITEQNLNNEGLFAMPVWPGPIDSIAAYPETDWGTCVHIDLSNNANGNGGIDYTCNNPTPENTYNLNDFIYHTINKEDAAYYNEQYNLKAHAGDYVILVAMHVTSREITRWTWQTFWWTPNPADPPAPSSSDIAGLRPLEYLSGAADHYAMASAFNMVSPPQPYYNGESVGDTVIAFNPYLEAGFGPGVFTGSNSSVINNGERIATDAGIRTNCMSCHAFASYNIDEKKSTTPYTGDAYVSLSDSLFEGSLRLDFAWSVANNVDTTGMQNFIETNMAADENGQ